MALQMKVKQKTPTTFADEALSVRFAHDAENYAAAAMALDGLNFHNVRYHLFCHAFELILKSFILSAGAKRSVLFDVGHSLNDALAEAVELGYKPAHGCIRFTKEMISAMREEAIRCFLQPTICSQPSKLPMPRSRRLQGRLT